MHLFERWGDMHLRVNGGSLDDPAHEALLPQLISVTEQSNNLIYRGRETNNNTLVPNWSYRAAMSYVTGTHAFKVGFNRTHGFLEEYQYAMNPVSYRFNGGVPESDHHDEPARTRRFRTWTTISASSRRIAGRWTGSR